MKTNGSKRWTKTEIELMTEMCRRWETKKTISERLGRSEGSVGRMLIGGSKRRQLQELKKKEYKMRKPAVPWMDDGQIRRAWRAAKDPDAQISILAQLNGVPATTIKRIIEGG